MLSNFFRRSFAEAATKAAAFGLTAAAATQVKNLLRGDFENKYLRIGLKTGGCAGFQYDFDFESKPRKNDHVFEKDGAMVLLDDHALLFLRSATLDYVTDKFSSTFKVNLPESSELHNCSCGKSVGTENHQHQCS